MKRKLKIMILFILLIVVCQIGITKVEALTVDSLKYKIITNYYGFKVSYDIYGTINSDTEFTTTYGGKGYYTFLQVGEKKIETS